MDLSCELLRGTRGGTRGGTRIKIADRFGLHAVPVPVVLRRARQAYGHDQGCRVPYYPFRHALVAWHVLAVVLSWAVRVACGDRGARVACCGCGGRGGVVVVVLAVSVVGGGFIAHCKHSEQCETDLHLIHWCVVVVGVVDDRRLAFAFPWVFQTAWCSLVGLPTYLTNKYCTPVGLGALGIGQPLSCVAPVLAGWAPRLLHT